MSKAYASNLTQKQWELLRPLIPPSKPGDRPRTVEMWGILNAILYLLCYTLIASFLTFASVAESIIQYWLERI